MEEWFDVSEAKPPKIGRYLVNIVNYIRNFGELTKMEVAIFNDDRFWDSSIEAIKGVTHWMFLPNEPDFEGANQMKKLLQECA